MADTQEEAPMPERGRLLSLRTMEDRSEVSRHTWRAWIREGRLATVRLGRRVLVAEEEYLRFLASRRG
jgi:excisionase family DNA binding protein